MLLVRPGRQLWVQLAPGKPDRPLSAASALAVFVHGACAHHAQWKHQIEAFREVGVTCLSYDAYGCGKSDKPRNPGAYDPEQHLLDLQALVAKYQSDCEKLVIVGHSFGTLMALCAAAKQPEKLVALILVAPFYPAGKGMHTVNPVFRLPEAALAVLQPQLTRGFLRQAYTLSFHTKSPQVVTVEASASNANPPHMFKAFYRQLGAWVDAHDVSALARNCMVPALIISGAEDQVTPPEMAKLLKSHYTKATVRLCSVPAASHQVMQEKPREVSQVMLVWLATLLKSKK